MANDESGDDLSQIFHHPVYVDYPVDFETKKGETELSPVEENDGLNNRIRD